MKKTINVFKSVKTLRATSLQKGLIFKSLNVKYLNIFVLLLFLSTKIFAQFAGGTGHSYNPYQIATPQHLANLAQLVNANDEDYNGRYYILTADIDLSQYGAGYNNGKGWIPIGFSIPFNGYFDGDNKTISNLYINNADLDEAYPNTGLFGVVDGYVRIENLNLENISVNGYFKTGGIAGKVENGVTISNCRTSGYVTGANRVGGIVGANEVVGIIENSYSTCDVNGFDYVGGIVGYTYWAVNISRCYSAGSVTGGYYVGGIAGYLDDMPNKINSCYSTGTISGEGFVGGIAGKIEDMSFIKGCYTTGVVIGKHDVGGITGQITNPIVAQRVNQENCAVFSPSIIGLNTHSYIEVIGRVTGSISGTPSIGGFMRIVNNAGWIGTLNADQNILWHNLGLYNRDGENISYNQIIADGTIGDRFLAANGWTTQNGKLPGLFGNTVDIPDYLTEFYIYVVDIVGVPSTAIVNEPLTLIGTVLPTYAENIIIDWSIIDPGTTGATLSGYTFNTTNAGTVTLKATVQNGTAPGEHYTKIFTIRVREKENYIKYNFGGLSMDMFTSVTNIPDGVVTVGLSFYDSYGNGDWTGIEGSGPADAAIVKFDYDCNLIWKRKFGGDAYEYFHSVVTVPDGFVTVGTANYFSFVNGGDWVNITPKGNDDATIVKFYNDGTPAWMKNFGGSGNDVFYSVETVSDGFVAVGYSERNSFGFGDWVNYEGRGFDDAIIVKYDQSGNVLWKNNFGGAHEDEFKAVTVVNDGIVAVGYSAEGSFGSGDWLLYSPKGGRDAIIVKYNLNGEVLWKTNFGGSHGDYFNSVTAVSDGVIAVGYSDAVSFGNGDWTNFDGKGGRDAIMVKYNYVGNIVWKKYFGGSGDDVFNSVKAVPDGFIATGYSDFTSFGNGDWDDYSGKGETDAILVKFDHNGNVIEKINFGGSGDDEFTAFAAIPDGVMAVGASAYQSFNNGHWQGVTGKGEYDAIIVKFDIIPVIPPVITTTSLGDGVVGHAYSQTLTATGDEPITWSIITGTLPQGLTLNPNTGEISGIPTVANTFNFTVKATNKGGFDLKQLSIKIESLPVPPQITTTTLPNGFVNKPYSQTLAATGSQPITWLIVSGSLPAGLLLNETTGLIWGTPTTENVYNFVVSASNVAGSDTKPLAIEIILEKPPTITTTSLPNGENGKPYSQTLLATGTQPITWSLVAGNLPTGLQLNATTGLISGIPTVTATFNFVVAASNNIGNDYKALSITVEPTTGPPVITTTSLPNGIEGEPYGAFLAATGSEPITWSIVGGSLPTGLSLNADTGEISGIPTVKNTFNFAVQATNSEGNDIKAFSIIITGETGPPVITTNSLPDGEIGKHYSAFLTATGAKPITWSIEAGNLPQGLNLNSATGEISGTPTVKGDSYFLVKAVNSEGDIIKALGITITDSNSIDELQMTNYKLRVYPNPTSGELRITGIRHSVLDTESPANIEGIAGHARKDLEVFDITGRVVFTSSLSLLSPETVLDITCLPAGIYFLKVGKEMVKVVKK